ncbi:MAG TPA: HDOD domain-containing protein [Gammaproteobacteria bacterium]|nr:HDOD domain-containing protein [Gammaproteobacteria bacterium]
MDVVNLINDILADLKANRLKLPTLPQVALKINDIIGSPDATAKKIAQVINTDAALSARMIQVANSPMMRSGSTVENVQAAVTRMGMSVVRNIVTSFLVNQLFHSKHEALKKRLTVVWNHSAHVAAISHVLADHFSKLKPDEAMLAGLVHDIGKLPMILKAENMPELANNPAVMDQVDEKLHSALGKVIVQTWGFAPELVTAVAEHENLSRDSEKLDLTDIVTVANLLSYAGKAHRHKQANWAEVPAFNKLDLSPEDSIAALEEARDEIAEIVKLLTS